MMSNNCVLNEWQVINLTMLLLGCLFGFFIGLLLGRVTKKPKKN